MKITESTLRKLVRKEIVEMAPRISGRTMVRKKKTTLTADIDYGFLEDAEPLHVGQDVTSYFEDDAPRPVKAVVMNPHGPGGGNPEITFTFLDEDHAWEWASNNLDVEYDDFMLMLNK